MRIIDINSKMMIENDNIFIYKYHSINGIINVSNKRVKVQAVLNKRYTTIVVCVWLR